MAPVKFESEADFDKFMDDIVDRAKAAKPRTKEEMVAALEEFQKELEAAKEAAARSRDWGEDATAAPAQPTDGAKKKNKKKNKKNKGKKGAAGATGQSLAAVGAVEKGPEATFN